MRNGKVYIAMLCAMLTDCAQSIDEIDNENEFSASGKHKRNKKDKKKDDSGTNDNGTTAISTNVINKGQNIISTDSNGQQLDFSFIENLDDRSCNFVNNQNVNFGDFVKYVCECLENLTSLNWETFCGKVLPVIQKLTYIYSKAFGEHKIGDKIYFGKLENNKYSGHGILYDRKNNKLQIGNFVDGKINGWTIILTSKQISCIIQDNPIWEKSNFPRSNPYHTYSKYCGIIGLSNGIKISQNGIEYGSFYRDNIVVGCVLKGHKLTLYNDMQKYKKSFESMKIKELPDNPLKNQPNVDLEGRNKVEIDLEEVKKQGKEYIKNIFKDGKVFYPLEIEFPKDGKVGIYVDNIGSFDKEYLNLINIMGNRPEGVYKIATSKLHNVISLCYVDFELINGKKFPFVDCRIFINYKNGRVNIVHSLSNSVHRSHIRVCTDYPNISFHLTNQKFIKEVETLEGISFYSPNEKTTKINPLLFCSKFVATDKTKSDTIDGFYSLSDIKTDNVDQPFSIREDCSIIEKRSPSDDKEVKENIFQYLSEIFPTKESYKEFETMLANDKYSVYQADVYDSQNNAYYSMLNLNERFFEKENGDDAYTFCVFCYDTLCANQKWLPMKVCYPNGITVKLKYKGEPIFFYKGFEIEYFNSNVKFTKKIGGKQVTCIFDEDMHLMEVHGDKDNIFGKIIYDKNEKIDLDRTTIITDTCCQDETDLEGYVDSGKHELDLDKFYDEFELKTLLGDIREIQKSVKQMFIAANDDIHQLSPNNNIEVPSASKEEEEEEEENKNVILIDTDDYKENVKFWKQLKSLCKIKEHFKQKGKPNPKNQEKTNQLKKQNILNKKEQKCEKNVTIFDITEGKQKKKRIYKISSGDRPYTYTYIYDSMFYEGKFLDNHNTLVCKDRKQLYNNVISASKIIKSVENVAAERMFQLEYCIPAIYVGDRHSEKWTNGSIRQMSIKGPYRLFYKMLENVFDEKNNLVKGKCLQIFSTIAHPKSKK